jgi:hypothetical protein
MESAGKRHIRLNVENACASAPSSLKTWLTSQTRRHYHRPTRSSRFAPPCSFRRSAVATAATRTSARSADGVSHPRRDDSRPSARRNTNRQRTPERVRDRDTPSPAAPVLLLPRISCCHRALPRELGPASNARGQKRKSGKSPAERGLHECAEEDSNLHPLSVDQALNLVTRVSYPSYASISSRSSTDPDVLDDMDDLDVATDVAAARTARPQGG